jgi:hypothetical protein
MSHRNRHPGDDTPDNDGGDGDGNPDARRKGRKTPRRKPPPLWRPKSEPRDVNLEMTAEDLDRSAKSRPARPPHRTPSLAHDSKRVEFRDVPGLGPEWRRRIMPPPPPR